MNPEDNKIFIALFVFIVAMVGVFSFMQAPSPTGYAVKASDVTYVNWLAIIVAAACIGVFAYWFNRKN